MATRAAGSASASASAEGAMARLVQRIFQFSVGEVYLDDDVRSNKSWMRTLKLLLALLRAKRKRVILFSRRYGEKAWTLCLAIASPDWKYCTQNLLGAAVDSNGRVTPLPTRTCTNYLGSLGYAPWQLSATSRQTPPVAVFLDDHEAIWLQLRELQPTYDESMLDSIWAMHKASPSQGETVRLAMALGEGFEDEEHQRRADAMPSGERGFEGHRYRARRVFADTQAASSIVDPYAAAQHPSLVEPAPFRWLNKEPADDLDDDDAFDAKFPTHGPADSRRNPMGVVARRFAELLAAATAATASAASAAGVTAQPGSGSSCSLVRMCSSKLRRVRFWHAWCATTPSTVASGGVPGVPTCLGAGCRIQDAGPMTPPRWYPGPCGYPGGT